MALDPGVIAEFKVMIDASTEKLQREMRQLKSRMYKDGRDTATIFSSSFTKAFGTAVSFGAMAAFVRNSVNAIGAMVETSKALGVNVEDFQKLKFAAEQSGVEQGKFESILKNISRTAGETALGIGRARVAYQALGIEVTGSNGAVKSTKDLFLQTVDALDKMGDSTERVAIAEKIFGAGGSILLNVGSLQDLNDLIREREEMGGIISTEEAERIEKAGDAVAKLAQTIKGNLMVAVSQFGPEIEQLATLFGAIARDSAKGIAAIGGQGESLAGAMARAQVRQDGLNSIVSGGDPRHTGPTFAQRLSRQTANSNPSQVGLPWSVSGTSTSVLPLGMNMPETSLPPRMEMLAAEVNRNTMALKESTAAIQAGWESIELPTSVTGRFTSQEVAANFVSTPQGMRLGSQGGMRGMPSVVNNFYGGNNFEAPEMAARKYNAQAALVPRAG